VSEQYEELHEVLVQWAKPCPQGYVPFYRLFYLPDVLDLKKIGYPLEKFEALFDLLEDAKVSHAQTVHSLLHVPGGNALWNPYKARQLEFNVRAALHRFGLSDAPSILRRTIGKAFPGDHLTHYAMDMINVFFWAALAQIARDYAWRSPQLEFMADYLEYPIRVAFGLVELERAS
jgi:hypothetical protein